MSNPFLGQLLAVPYNFAPQGWALCNGQLLAITQNTALFSLLGTTYGGNGTTTFGLPDLRGRVPISSGQGPGLSDYFLGEAAGAETTAGIVAHTHALGANAGLGTTDSPAGAVPAAGGSYAASGDGTALVPTGSTGSSAIDIRDPYLTINWIIALSGIFPSRN